MVTEDSGLHWNGARSVQEVFTLLMFCVYTLLEGVAVRKVPCIADHTHTYILYIHSLSLSLLHVLLSVLKVEDGLDVYSLSYCPSLWSSFG